MKVVKILIAAFVITVCFISLSFAAAGGRGRGTGMGRGGAAAIPAQRAASMQGQLNLSDEQVAKLNEITAADMNNMQKLQAALTSANTALTIAEMSDDEAKVKDAIKAIESATGALTEARMAEYKKIKGILTEEQFKQFQTAVTTPARGRIRGTTPGNRGTVPRGRNSGTIGSNSGVTII